MTPSCSLVTSGHIVKVYSFGTKYTADSGMPGMELLMIEYIPVYIAHGCQHSETALAAV